LGALGFLAAVIIEHALDPSLDPATHQVSEYVHGPAGALMTMGFLAWAISLGASSALASMRLRARGLACALALAAIGMLITASFETQTSAGRLPPGASLTWSGRLHDIGSGTTTIALFAAVLLSLHGTIRERQFRHRASALLVLAVCCDAALLAVGSQVGGLRERLLILAGCTWQLMFLAAASRQSGTEDLTG